MKGIPSILEYILLLDYAVARGEAHRSIESVERSGPEGKVVSDDGYIWVIIDPKVLYKTPFKSASFLGVLPEYKEVYRLLYLWAHQYDKMRVKVDFRKGNYAQAIFDYMMGAVLVPLGSQRQPSALREPFDFIRVGSSPPRYLVGNRTVWFEMPKHGNFAVVEIDGSSQKIVISSSHEQILFGFYIKPKIVFPTIEQLINFSYCGRATSSDNTVTSKYYLSTTGSVIGAIETSLDNIDNKLRTELRNLIDVFGIIIPSAPVGSPIESLFVEFSDYFGKAIPQCFIPDYLSLNRMYSFIEHLKATDERARIRYHGPYEDFRTPYWVLSNKSNFTCINIKEIENGDVFIEEVKNKLIDKLVNTAACIQVKVKNNIYYIKGFELRLTDVIPDVIESYTEVLGLRPRVPPIVTSYETGFIIPPMEVTEITNHRIIKSWMETTLTRIKT